MADFDLPSDKLLVLYDGVCGLCHRWVQFVLARDRKDRFRFAALQDSRSRSLLMRHGHDPDALDTVVVVVAPGTDAERLILRGRAGLRMLRGVGGIYALSVVVGIAPTFIIDWFYNRVARNRYQRHGKLDACQVPAADQRHKFVDH